MEGNSFKCPSCGNVLQEADIDFKTRRATCPYCDRVSELPRREINGAAGVQHDLENAIRFFNDKNYDLAKNYAEHVLSISYDNIVALFILGYHRAYHAATKSRSDLEKFFTETLPGVETDPEEIEMFKGLLLKCILHVSDYEENILGKFLETLPDAELAEFVEGFSPYIINKRVNIDWFTPRMCDIYAEITKKVDIPKTWYALFQQISTNPDSPESENTFYLKTKTQRFYDNFVCGIGKIYSGIINENFKAKFCGALDKKKQIYFAKMK